MAAIKQAPPWVTYVSELEQMFKYDPEVHVIYNNDEHEVKLYVDASQKASALTELLPEVKEFGTVALHIIIVPANGTIAANKANLYQSAFKGNGALSFVKTVHGIFSNDLTYVVFRNRVVQYFDDNLGDVYGQRSTLYQEIANNLFEDKEGVFFCTDVEEPVYQLGNPLGEWP